MEVTPCESSCRKPSPRPNGSMGRPLQKMSPRERHSRAQTNFVAALGTWADETGSGRVGTEWDFRIAPPGEPRRPLVPDIAYLSYDTTMMRLRSYRASRRTPWSRSSLRAI